MKDINQLEKEKIYQWACENYTEEVESRYFTKIDKSCRSYFEETACPGEYCKEYNFQTVDELRRELSVLWKEDMVMERIFQAVLVAAMKNKPSMADGSGLSGKMEEVKPFIYNF